MKAAMWGVGIIVLGLFTLVMINLFGNITVTDEFNYTTMKNAVQSAMYDSLDLAYYRTGFCLCTTDGSEIGTEQKKFSNKNQYTLKDIVDGTCGDTKSCVALIGEYRLDANKFSENFKERFEKMISNNKGYNYVIKEIIEYPPKVSVRVVSTDEEFFPTDKDAGGYSIVNQLDAIIETNNGEPHIAVLQKEEENYTCQIDDTSYDEYSSSQCKWHAKMTVAYYTVDGKSKVGLCEKKTNSLYETLNQAINANKTEYANFAKNSCVKDKGEYTKNNLDGYLYYNVYKDGKLYKSGVEAKNATLAITTARCEGKCVARCYN